MDNQRVFLWAGLLFILFLVYQAWQQDYRQPATPAAARQAAVEGADSPAAPAGQAMEDVLPALPRAEPQTGPDGAPEIPGAVVEEPAGGRRIRVITDVLDIQIDTQGGDIRRLTLPGYPVKKTDPDNVIVLLDATPPKQFVYRTGLRIAGEAADEPNHLARFDAEQYDFTLAEGQDELVVPLSWGDDRGLEVRKIYRFRRGSYDIGLEMDVRNGSAEPVSLAPYLQILRPMAVRKRSMTDVDSYSFVGPVIYDGEKYDKLDVDDLEEEPFSMQVSGGWMASIQHHFLAAAIPEGDAPYTYSVQQRGGLVLQSAIGPLATLGPGDSMQFVERLFAGPKVQDQLTDTAPGLKLTVDYGMLTIIAQPLFWVLTWLYKLTGNWGWAIILLTLLIKLAFYKLSETSGRSMARMRQMQPRIKHLQERYADDRQGLSQAMMELYRKEKVNPAAGCLPILVQMPVFIALYWVLLESVEMRQAPFMLWIDDLSVRDPYFILPLLMGITMFVQQKLNPAPPDPVQAKVMMILPVVFSVFFAFFPSGLVLYWFTNNLLSIAQQWRINKVVEAAAKH